jgi:DNA polymerase sigma
VYGNDAVPVAFGSFATSISTFASDIDLCIYNWHQSLAMGAPSRKRVVHALSNLTVVLRTLPWVMDVDARLRARVPIINFKERPTKVEVDLCLDGLGEQTISAVTCMAQSDAAFRPLALVLKVALSQWHLDSPFTGGIGSYKLYVMIAHLLQRRTKQRSKLANGNGKAEDANANHGDILVQFFDYYRLVTSSFPNPSIIS